MAIKLLSVNGIYNNNIVEYIVDEEDEKDNIPVEDKIFGTKVKVVKSGKTYTINSSSEWIEEE